MKVLVSRRASADRVYHTNPDCMHVTENNREWDLSTAKNWGYRQCKQCEKRDEVRL